MLCCLPANAKDRAGAQPDETEFHRVVWDVSNVAAMGAQPCRMKNLGPAFRTRSGRSPRDLSGGNAELGVHIGEKGTKGKPDARPAYQPCSPLGSLPRLLKLALYYPGDILPGRLPMIVLYRNGEQRVITGWREWLIWLAAAVILVVLACLALGIALTLFTIAVFALPIAIVLVLIASLVQPRR